MNEMNTVVSENFTQEQRDEIKAIISQAIVAAAPHLIAAVHKAYMEANMRRPGSSRLDGHDKQ